MLIKVCGMFCSENIAELIKLKPDMLGLIFYAKSPRNAFNANADYVSKIRDVEKVAVFVNEEVETMHALCQKYAITHIQLHGKESVETIKELKSLGYKITKAISIANKEDLGGIAPYDEACDRILLDTKCDSHGGSGKKFDWAILEYYCYKSPFMLSGGITLDDASEILAIQNPKLLGVDINSRFECENNLKDIRKIQNFIKKIRNDYE
ncbi:MAG: phosphoribosylanthranilate isomerase [Opitutales bacterium]